MIKSFRHKGLNDFFETGNKKGIVSEHSAGLARILDRLDASKSSAAWITIERMPPGGYVGAALATSAPLPWADREGWLRHTSDVYNAINDTHRRCRMRTNVVIDDKLMKSAQEAAGLKTKKETIEEGLKLLVQLRRQAGVKDLRGRLDWSGDLDEMRLDK